MGVELDFYRTVSNVILYNELQLKKYGRLIKAVDTEEQAYAYTLAAGSLLVRVLNLNLNQSVCVCV